VTTRGGAVPASRRDEAGPDLKPAISRPATAPLDSRDLLGNTVERAILHGEEVYRLRLTRAGKLILTK
jgi:hemin uptake protein HemP